MQKKTQDIIAYIRPYLSVDGLLFLGIQVGTFLILLTPYVEADFSIFPSIYPKVIYFRSLVEIVFLFYILLLLRNTKFLPRLSPLFIAVLVFVEILAFATWKGINPERSFWGTVERGEGFILFLHLFLLFVVLVSVFRSKEIWMRFLSFIALLSIPLGIMGIAENLAYEGKGYVYIITTFGNPIFYANYLVFTIFISLFLAIEGFTQRGILTTTRVQSRNDDSWVALAKGVWKNRWILFGALFVFNIFMLLLTVSRGAIIGVASGFAAMLVMWFLFEAKGPRHQLARKAILFSTFLFLLFFLFFLLFSALGNIPENRIIQRYENLWGKIVDTSTDSRYRVWQLGVEAWKDSWLFGYGPDSFSYIYDTYYKPDMLSVIPETLFFDRGHSKVIDLLVFSGIIGLVSYIAVFLSAAYSLWKNKGREFTSLSSLLLIAFFIAYFVQNLVSIETVSPFIFFFFILAFITSQFQKPRSKSEDEGRSYTTKSIVMRPEGRMVVALLAVATAGFSLWYANILPLMASRDLASAHRLFGQGQREQGFVALDSALGGPEFLMPEFSYYATETLFNARRLPSYNNPEAQDEFGQFTDRSLRVLERQFANTAEALQLRAYILAGRVYIDRYATTSDTSYLQDSERMLAEAIKLNPDYLRSYRVAGKTKFLEGEGEDGVTLFFKALNGDSDIATFYEWYGESLIDIGEVQAGAGMLRRAMLMNDFYTEKKFRLDLVWNLAAAYERVGDWRSMIDYYEEVLMHYPGDLPNPQLFASLSVVYMKDGNPKMARDATERMLKIYPGLRADAEEFLSSLENKE